jgi:hypothetical protein
MVDLSRLLKKIVIKDKLGFKVFGSEKKESKGQEIKDPRVQNFFSIQKQPKPKAQPREYGGFKAPSFPSFRSSGSGSGSSSKVPAAIGIYIGLIVISIIGLILKNFIAYSPTSSLFISIILGLFFFIAIHYTPEAKLKEGMVFLTFALDTFTQFMLGLFPESELKNWLITYHVFAWIILAVVLFLMGVVDTMGAGQSLGKGGWLLVALILGVALFFLFPILIQGPSIFQDESHAEYFNIAKAQVVKVAGTLEETKNVWYDYFSCTFSIVGGNVKYDACMDDKRIARYCKNNVQSESRQQCFQEQKELQAQGNKPGIAGQVSEAIKQVTILEMKEDQFFPKKATDTKTVYPIPLKVQNPRKQIFTAKVSCEFKKNKEIIPGTVTIGGQEITEVQINSKEQQFLIGCQPTADLNGRYTLEYDVILAGMQTFSFLKRAFINKDIDAALRTQIETDNFKTKDKVSQGPAEFALLNFKFGSGDGSAPLVLVDEPITFSFAVEDVGSGAFKGEILKVNNYNFHGLWERGFSVDAERQGEENCLQGGEINVVAAQTKKREPSELKRCFLNLPPDLSQLQQNQYKIETFVADLNYDYRISKTIPIEVIPLEVTNETLEVVLS